MKKLLLFFTLLFAVYIKTFSATCTASSGDWSNSIIWSCGRLPTNNDIVIIPEGVTVNVDGMFGTFSGFRLEVYGTLNFINGRKITLTADGEVYISNTGEISGGNGGSQFSIGSTDIYVGGGGNATGDLFGPLDCSSGGCGASTVPIKLISFTASKTNDGVLLTWVTETETNNEYYSIERSTDGIDFEVISKVKGAGNSIFSLEYTYLDKPLKYGTIYYRLKQTDYNGDFEYFDMITVYNEIETNDPVLYPNPSNGGNIKFYYHNKSLSNFKLEMTSLAGMVIFYQEFKNTEEYISQVLDLSLVKKGSYFVNVYQGDQVISHKLIVN